MSATTSPTVALAYAMVAAFLFALSKVEEKAPVMVAPPHAVPAE